MKGAFSRTINFLRHPVVLCLVSFLLCLFLGLLIFFPLAPFARQLEQMAATQHLEVQIERPQVLFPFGVGAEQIDVAYPQLVHPPFQLKNVQLHPQWLSLFGGNPGLDVNLELMQGVLTGEAYRDGTARARLTNLQLDEKLGPQLPLIFKGLVEKANFDGVLPLAGKNQSRVQLTARDLRLEGLKKYGSANDNLPIGQLKLSANIKGPNLQVQTFTTSGPAFDLKGNGSIRIGNSPARSSLNLSLVLTPKTGLDPMLKDLLSLTKKPRPDGSYLFSLSGPLSKPRIY